MNKNFKILDCTLRDGGYYTNWDFDKDLVKMYFQSFNHLPVDYLEIGYRSNPMNKYLGEYFYCPEYILKQTRELSNKKLVIILNEKDVRAEHVPDLLGPCRGYIAMVRIAIDPQNFTRALKLAEAVKSLNFEVGFNVMYMSNWSDYPDFLNQLENVNGIADYFYMVDSYGGVYPNDVKDTFNIVREKTDVDLGFHGHNNLQLGLINTLTAIECGVSIVDSTVTGMGRGAGNLSTELLLTALNAKDVLKQVDFNALSKIVDPFAKMQKDYDWGTNLPYMVSGANSLPQKEVMEWVTKRYYSLNSIIRALSNKSLGVKDNVELKEFNTKGDNYDEAIIIGGGPSASNFSKAVKEFIQNKPNCFIIHSSSKNAKKYKDVDCLQIHCLAGNEGHRLEEALHEISETNKMAILPPYPRTMGTYIPSNLEKVSYQLNEITFTSKYLESVTSLAFEILVKMKIKRCYVIGYDGYDGNISPQEMELFNENEYLFNKIKEKGINPVALTPTKYSELNQQSVFSLI